MEELYGYREQESGRRFVKVRAGRRLVFRRLGTASELGPYVRLLNEIWGFSDAERLPLHEAVVSVMTGGLFLGLEVDGESAGLVYVMPAWGREWGYHHHSNFMGFRPEHRGLGLGVEAKRVHAALAAREGVELVTWTFDPLQAANGNLNFRKLGGVCRTYWPDLYGSMGGRFDPGLPTDRFLVEWRPASERARRRLQGGGPLVEEAARRFADAPRIIPGTTDGDEVGSESRALVAIPAGVHELARDEPAAARAALAGFGSVMRELLDRGLVVTEMFRSGSLDNDQYYGLEREVEW
jgi:predicted GNAT superfamily acetyltransferase